jgi:5-methylcytosine-specific restriction endonuclease McrA
MSAMFKKVLLLNSSYQPITFCSMKKAIILMFLEKAEVVQNRSDEKILGVSSNFNCPSIIRLKEHRPLKIKVQLNRKNILKRDGFKCVYCESRYDLTIDHVVPKSRGGKTSWENLVTACNDCNNKKDNKLLHESGMIMRTKPRIPNRIVFLRQEVNNIEEDWKPYLYIN